MGSRQKDGARGKKRAPHFPVSRSRYCCFLIWFDLNFSAVHLSFRTFATLVVERGFCYILFACCVTHPGHSAAEAVNSIMFYPLGASRSTSICCMARSFRYPSCL